MWIWPFQLGFVIKINNGDLEHIWCLYTFQAFLGEFTLDFSEYQYKVWSVFKS
jgi:hypothetical protein